MQQSDPFIQMINVMRRFYPISAAFILRLREMVYFMDYSEEAVILHYKEVQRCCWVQFKGSTAEVNVDPVSLQETTTWLWFTDDFLYTIPGFFRQQPSGSYVEILEDSSFICISFADFNTLRLEFPETLQLTENIWDGYERLKLQRYILLTKQTAEKRTKKLYSSNEGLFIPRLRNRSVSTAVS
jgi:hypothetical protein